MVAQKQDKNRLKIGVFFGGRSVEHEISILSAEQVIAALDRNKYQIVPIYITKRGAWYTGNALLNVNNFKNIERLLSYCQQILVAPTSGAHAVFKMPQAGWLNLGRQLLATIDIAFPVMHGTHGEDGALQGLFELMNIPYVGSNILASAITMDKICTKLMLHTLGVPLLDFLWFYAHDWMDNQYSLIAQVKEKFGYPVIVKPADLGSSIGVSVANNDNELEDAVDLAFSLSARVMVEPKIVNLKEVNCAVLGDREGVELSALEEPLRAGQVLSYQDKYIGGGKAAGGDKWTDPSAGAAISGGAKAPTLSAKGMSGAKRKIPADIPENMAHNIKKLARDTFVNLDCSGVVRIDFLINLDTNYIYLCEVNAIPGSLAFYLWEPIGKKFPELLDRLIELARKRYRQKNNLNLSYDTNILALSGKGINK